MYCSVLKIIARRGRTVADLQQMLSRAEEYVALVERPEKRASYLYFNPLEVLSIREGKLTRQRGRTSRVIDQKNPLLALKDYLSGINHQSEETLPTFSAGFFGYLGYDCVRYLEKITLPKKATTEAEACFLFYGDAIVIDSRSDRMTLVVTRASRKRAQRELDALARRLDDAPVAPKAASKKPVRIKDLKPPRRTPAKFEKSALTVRNHILDGDIFQCVLSERYQFPRRDPLKVFQALIELNPSPYHFYFKAGAVSLVGASPEPLIEVDGKQNEVLSHPIAGTRPRGRTKIADARYETQLRSSTKETAEHIMLVDLARNDLGRVCVPGTIDVRELMKTVRYSHVMHLVSIVGGTLRSDMSALDALLAAFPAGTLTGAPKVRAMEIISQLEPQRRGAYGGAVVQYDFMGNLDSCITIRSAVITKRHSFIQAGAGLVFDSKPDREFHEIFRKSLAVRQALDMAKGGEPGR